MIPTPQEQADRIRAVHIAPRYTDIHAHVGDYKRKPVKHGRIHRLLARILPKEFMTDYPRACRAAVIRCVDDVSHLPGFEPNTYILEVGSPGFHGSIASYHLREGSAGFKVQPGDYLVQLPDCYMAMSKERFERDFEPDMSDMEEYLSDSQKRIDYNLSKPTWN